MNDRHQEQRRRDSRFKCKVQSRIGETNGEIEMNARNDEWHNETNCKLIGGPWDGNVLPMKRGWSECVITNTHLATGENLENSLQELNRKAVAGEILSEGDIEKHFDEQRERDEQDGVKLPPRGHKYCRGEDGTTFHYVGPISLEESRRWSRRNLIPPQRNYDDKAMWERQYGHAIDGDD